jgi:hypothetical protein
MAVANEFGTLFNHGATGGFIGFKDNNGKVLRAQEGWDGIADLVKALLKPCSRLG